MEKSIQSNLMTREQAANYLSLKKIDFGSLGS